MKAVVDRIEGDTAVLLIGEEETRLDIPLRLLPEGTREGSHLTIAFELDKDSEEKKRQEISSLLDKLSRKKR
ncbi:MAG: DUF3006 domain-containing protein [Clostridiales bacterium]|jgi:hypothetical protein|nr:DUF3006 domain-containing protein [Clostridiales bacterium]